MEDERVVGIVYGAEGSVGRWSVPKLYDLVFTNHRIVGITTARTAGARMAGQLLGGVIGQAIAASVAKSGADRTRRDYAGRPLDDIVAADNANFSAPYGSIRNAAVKGLLSKRLQMHVNGKIAVFALPSAQVARTERLVAEQVRR